jgi:hypothetical protein
MRLLTIIFSFILTFDAFAKVDTTFSELRGLDDSLGQTHLFYRKTYTISDSFGYLYSNSIYHFDVANIIDTFFLADVFEDYPSSFSGISVEDYEFWDNDPAKFIYGGLRSTSIDNTPYISRFDIENVFSWWGGITTNIEISRQNDSLVYASIYEQLIVSNDGGFNWTFDTVSSGKYELISISPFDDQVFFFLGIPFMNDGLWKSVNGGATYYLVDSTQSVNSNRSKIYFDPDSLHLYAVNYTNPSGYNVLTSSDVGENWNILYTDTASLNLAVDNQQSGLLYLSIDSQIKVSSDYGATFSDFATLNRPVIGMYKKPGTDLLYVATEKNIYEISAGSITSIKSLPVTIEPGSQPVPEGFVLYQNYPNPFNSGTTIEFYLPQTAEIKIEIYNLLGQKVWTLWQGRHPAGQYQLRWDGTDEMGREVASGVYIYRVQTKDFVQSRKMLFLK